MNKKLFLVILMAALSAMLLTGCWDRKELNQLGIAMAIGLDKGDDGKIQLTSQIVRPSAIQKKGGGNEPPYELVISSGDSVFEAIRHTVKEFDRRSFFSHIKVIVVGEEYAREGLEDTIDFITRSHELRKTTWLIVASDCKASEVLGVKHGLEKVQANYMEGILKSQEIESSSAISKVIDFIKAMPGEGNNPVTGVFSLMDVKSVPSEGTEPEQRKGLKLSGSALFKKDKLAGFLDNKDTLGLNILNGKCKKTSINVQALNNKADSQVTIELIKIKCSIKPSINKEGNISFNVAIKAEGNMTEVKQDLDVTNLQLFEQINSNFSNYIKLLTDKSINNIQKNMKTDVIGFGRTFEIKYPKIWSKIKDKWNDAIFPNVSYTVKVDTRLNRTGLTLKPLNAKKLGK
ncbi:germination protein, Ger(x)C family [Ruminiclostridium papyrosolvens DSM 2782]|uniref:Germination protein, Ger(X)C family n=1 Tax=Ruminiclostridium papyrosolvens DSM 2782 TaxID=588581 RepID=F1T9V0_9FIRM|nr:Ger(x)C family spore germination protein [Ruminiclostridium papyrosolvens]EGD48692.1 germination protein, Ger(x)C family [Ruminiclostridium papyrosolvens DSM 2782]WES32551.1 Ger(x)C family spore germination protein [Ruminiclostridium papyrosolvens DSM 2782]